MKLRNGHLAVIERHKIVEYLLNPEHPGNGGKAKFFTALGFSIDDPGRLISAFRAVAQNGEVTETVHSVYGEKCVVDGWLPTQIEGGEQRVRTVWVIDAGGEAPRLVTAYPGKR